MKIFIFFTLLFQSTISLAQPDYEIKYCVSELRKLRVPLPRKELKSRCSNANVTKLLICTKSLKDVGVELLEGFKNCWNIPSRSIQFSNCVIHSSKKGVNPNFARSHCYNLGSNTNYNICLDKKIPDGPIEEYEANYIADRCWYFATENY